MAGKDENFNMHTPDGHYFKLQSDFEKKKLIDLSDRTERFLETDMEIPDEFRGLLRSAAGNARLLVNQKFKQFEQLIERNLNPKKGELPVQCQDLAGFWDLMLIEVRSLNKSFADLSKLSKNNWEIIDVKPDRTSLQRKSLFKKKM